MSKASHQGGGTEPLTSEGATTGTKDVIPTANR